MDLEKHATQDWEECYGLHDFLWQTFTTPSCNHGSPVEHSDDARLSSEAVALLGYYYSKLPPTQNAEKTRIYGLIL